MPVCSNCNAEQPSSEVTSCILCGYPVKRDDDVEDSRTDDESMEFVASESAADSREFVGGQKEQAKPVDDDLGIETTTDLMDQESHRDDAAAAMAYQGLGRGGHPIGESAPPPPPMTDYSEPARPAEPEVESAGEMETEDAPTTGQVKKLSEQEVKQIEQNLYGSSGHLREQEKQALAEKLRKLNDAPAPAEPAVEESTIQQTGPSTPEQTARPKTPRKGTGVAFFYKNFIQLVGRQSLMTNDVISINNKEYVLKPKTIKTGYVVGGSAILLTILLIFLGSLLSPASGAGQGQLVGVVLDQNDRPYIQGALIHVPKLDRKIESDARGFFNAGEVDAGTYDVEYIVDGHVVQVEQASVVGGEIRMLLLKPAEEDQFSDANSQPEEPEPVKVASVSPQASRQPASTSSNDRSSSSQSASSSSTPTSTQKPKNGYGKIKLAANIENARFEVDGGVMGAGNLTYSKIKSGRHRYRVSADGYQPVEGNFTLEPGETRRLAVELQPLQQQQKAASFNTDDYFYSGKNALDSDDYVTAITDFSKAIDNSPDYADAYYLRGQAYSGHKQHEKAYDDYIRAAEIYCVKKSFGRAISSYEKAIECDEDGLSAYLGRGNLYLRKGEVLAAIADFDQAKKIDKRSFQAYYGLGEARFKQQQFKRAIKHFKDARSINDQDPKVHQYLMLSYLAMADYDEVKKSFEKFAEIATDEQMNRFRSDQKFSAVIKVVESQ